ncbi:2',3'-cyclic-nucleotide 3'-phosphodiesterase [Dendryphion nanum]|uniref:2',3'-cyclic-nucleotide 3'-phosphodiesterase n=1 Tax=Dendryphion nanum TaxID=256645 RepID=A0A9P9D8U8_9PLEO|nr:2',3'-cyclic-nucleotide 3'-phosphodiesterase [Dendryphion nanum]
MPGSSLWLLPPPNHPLNGVLFSLIQEVASHFDSPHLFLPHVTLTTDIDPSIYGTKSQNWLDSIELPKATEVQVKFDHLNSEDVFFRKLYVKVVREGVATLGEMARKHVDGFSGEDVARKWVDGEYVPHLSLLYHDCAKLEDEELEEINKLAIEHGLSLEGEGDFGSWQGGRVVLVPTDRPIKEWEPIAERLLL